MLQEEEEEEEQVHYFRLPLDPLPTDFSFSLLPLPPHLFFSTEICQLSPHVQQCTKGPTIETAQMWETVHSMINICMSNVYPLSLSKLLKHSPLLGSSIQSHHTSSPAMLLLPPPPSKQEGRRRKNRNSVTSFTCEGRNNRVIPRGFPLFFPSFRSPLSKRNSDSSQSRDKNNRRMQFRRGTRAVRIDSTGLFILPFSLFPGLTKIARQTV